MLEDGTWKQELGEKDQIIALSTKLTEMQAKFDQQIASFTSQTKDEKGAAAASTSNSNSNGNCLSKQDPYFVAVWRLIKKEDMVTVNGKDYHWCTGDHYSGVEKHNGMYADHKSSKHDAWRKNMDDRLAARGSGNKPSNEAPTPIAAAPPKKQKLALNDKLWNAFCTQAGLSAEAINCIREDAQGFV
jgi:hypothetical protein